MVFCVVHLGGMRVYKKGKKRGTAITAVERVKVMTCCKIIKE